MKRAYGACTSEEEKKAEGEEVSHEKGDKEEESDEGDDEEGVVGLGRGLSDRWVRETGSASREFGSGFLRRPGIG